ncbi:MAG: TlpA family protein disulfide reductase [Elusimicrobia bacterium]|nr:TlpA family protein disulfide reductase [Elusimicrobiota bacterium]
MKRRFQAAWRRLPSPRETAGLLAVVLVGAWLLGPGPRTEDHSHSPLPAAELALPDISGKTARLSDFKGRVVLVDFWATWCYPCLQELPDLKALYRRHEGKGFVILAVSIDEGGKEAVAAFVAENKVPYPVLLAGSGPIKGWRVRGLPVAHLIDREGRIVRSWVGYKDPSELEGNVKALLSGEPIHDD